MNLERRLWATLGSILLSLEPTTLLAVAAQAAVEDVELRTPLRAFVLSRDGIDTAGKKGLPFVYQDEDQVCDFRIRVGEGTQKPVLLGSADFSVVDTMVSSGRGEYAFKLRFSELSSTEFLRLRFSDSGGARIQEIPLLPATDTRIQLDTAGLEFYVGQEKSVEILVSDPDNIAVSAGWIQSRGFEYRLSESDAGVLLHVLPDQVGARDFSIPIPLRKPALVDGRPGARQILVKGRFLFRSATYPFFRIDPPTFVLDDKSSREGWEIQMEANRSIRPGRTYRLEESAVAGGPAVGEIFAKERLATGRILSVLRAFGVHRRSSGVLFLKDADVPLAVTNIDVLPRVRLERIRVMRNGKDWEDGAEVHPGETVHVRIEGQSLDQAKIGFGDLALPADARGISSEGVFECRLAVPPGISRPTIPVLDHDRPTGKALQVREVETARAFDFVSVDHGSGPRPVSSLSGPELHRGSIRDVVLRFDPSRIDSGSLHGKQYLSLEAKVFDPAGTLLEYGRFDDIAICPDAPSPRASYYDRSDCDNAPVSLNERLTDVNTCDLQPWSRISLTISDATDAYESPRQPRRIEIYRQERTWFDVDVSFPVGLLVHRIGDEGWADFSGVSMAVMAKWGLYERGAIAKKEPWEFDAGFIALNAFDLGSGSERDLGVVALLTLQPVNTSRKLSFPIYMGGGYLISSGKWFWLLGPGISVQF